MVDRYWVFPCILRCCMAIGRLQVAFVEARLEAFPKENAEAVQPLLYRAHTGVKLGASTAVCTGLANPAGPAHPRP